MPYIFGYPPSNNLYWRNCRGRTFVSKEAVAYKKQVALDAETQRMKLLTGPLILRLDIYRPRKSGDLSNRIKVIEDALQGIAYENDSQIVEIHARRFDSKIDPHVEVTIEEASDA